MSRNYNREQKQKQNKFKEVDLSYCNNYCNSKCNEYYSIIKTFKFDLEDQVILCKRKK